MQIVLSHIRVLFIFFKKFKKLNEHFIHFARACDQPYITQPEIDRHGHSSAVVLNPQLQHIDIYVK